MANSTWWKRRSAMERGLMVIAVSVIILCIAFIIGIGVLVLNSTSCDVTTTAADPAKTEILSSTAEALGGQPTLIRRSAAVKCTDDDVCLSPGCIHTASTILENMDSDVEPCNDFYKFACGGFIKNIDNTRNKNTFSVIKHRLDNQLRTAIEAKSKPNEPKPFTLVKNLYKACMNETAIESQGLAPLQNMLKKLGGWPVLDGDRWLEDEFDWKSSMYKFRNVGYRFSHLIDFIIGVDLKYNTKRVISLDEPNLGLSREYLTKGFDDEIVQAYYSFMVDIAVMLGAKKDRAMTELKKSLHFEMKLAEISLPTEKRRNASQLYNPMTLTELTKRYSSVPWKEYFSNLLPPTITVEDNEVAIVNVPSYITKLEKLLARTPKRVQANYIMWTAAMSSIGYLNDDIRKRERSFLSVFSGQVDCVARWYECLNVVSERLSLNVGAMYVRKYFNEESKKKAIEIVMATRDQFTKILKQVEWMDEKTKQKVLEKAASMSAYIAYPDELLDDKKLEKVYKGLELSSDNYFESMLNLTVFDTEDEFIKLRKPVNKNNWVSRGSPMDVNAYYLPIENSIQFPAGILQGAFFSNDRPRYMNYGAIGFVIGHEITHGFDDQGRQFDKDGNLVNWWTPTIEKRFLKRAECIIHQYKNYTVEDIGVNLDGVNTQSENIADNGGMKAAYLAYNDWVSRNEQEQKLPGLDYTPQQMFWLSAANTWCAKYTPEALKLNIMTSAHIPGEFRILGTLSNMPEFSKDFNCPIGSKMNPEKKCSVW